MRYLQFILLVLLCILLGLFGCVASSDPTERVQAFTIRVCNSSDVCFDTLVMVKP